MHRVALISYLPFMKIHVLGFTEGLIQFQYYNRITIHLTSANKHRFKRNVKLAHWNKNAYNNYMDLKVNILMRYGSNEVVYQYADS